MSASAAAIRNAIEAGDKAAIIAAVQPALNHNGLEDPYTRRLAMTVAHMLLAGESLPSIIAAIPASDGTHDAGREPYGDLIRLLSLTMGPASSADSLGKSASTLAGDTWDNAIDLDGSLFSIRQYSNPITIDSPPTMDSAISAVLAPHPQRRRLFGGPSIYPSRDRSQGGYSPSQKRQRHTYRPASPSIRDGRASPPYPAKRRDRRGYDERADARIPRFAPHSPYKHLSQSLTPGPPPSSARHVCDWRDSDLRPRRLSRDRSTSLVEHGPDVGFSFKGAAVREAMIKGNIALMEKAIQSRRDSLVFSNAPRTRFQSPMEAAQAHTSQSPMFQQSVTKIPAAVVPESRRRLSDVSATQRDDRRTSRDQAGTVSNHIHPSRLCNIDSNY